jgi:palmitoyltransferase
MIIFNILTILLAGSLYMTSKTNPGTTPVYWGFHIGDEDFKKRRYCLLCQVFKPERTHHCSICNLCILNMDHHCPWVDNCIGFYNKKFFIQLLCYFLIISFGLCITYIPYSIDIIELIYKIYKKEILDKEMENKYYFYLINNILLIGFTIVDFNFLKFHMKLIKSNLTTIETLDNDLMQNKKYDMGLEINFKQIFGENKLLWFLPINLPSGYPMGDGLTWPNKFDIIPLDNLNINDNKTIDNCNNEIENKLNTEINIIMNNNENDNTADEKIIKNDSYHRNISPINIGSERTLSTQRFSTNYSKYNVVKRNSGNCNSNFTGFETNDTKKTYSGRNEDNVPK